MAQVEIFGKEVFGEVMLKKEVPEGGVLRNEVVREYIFGMGAFG